LLNKFNNLCKENDDLKERYDRLEKERGDLVNDRDNWRRKYEETRSQLTNELNAEKLRNSNAMASEKLSRQSAESTLAIKEENLKSTKVEIISLKKQIEDGKNELSLVRLEKDNQLTQKNNELKDVEKSLADLRIENEKEKTQKDAEINQKDDELQRKEEKIKNLLSQKELSQEELLIEKLRSEKVNLESFATELKVDLEKIQGLIRDHKQLFQVQKSFNQTNIDIQEANISRTKRDLQGLGVGIITIQEVCRKCEKIAQLN